MVSGHLEEGGELLPGALQLAFLLRAAGAQLVGGRCPVTGCAARKTSQPSPRLKSLAALHVARSNETPSPLIQSICTETHSESNSRSQLTAFWTVHERGTEWFGNLEYYNEVMLSRILFSKAKMRCLVFRKGRSKAVCSMPGSCCPGGAAPRAG